MKAVGALLRLITIFILATALPCRAEDAMSGRWEGTARVPDYELTVIVDLAQENGAWVGSIIIPGPNPNGGFGDGGPLKQGQNGTVTINIPQKRGAKGGTPIRPARATH